MTQVHRMHHKQEEGGARDDQKHQNHCGLGVLAWQEGHTCTDVGTQEVHTAQKYTTQGNVSCIHTGQQKPSHYHTYTHNTPKASPPIHISSHIYKYSKPHPQVQQATPISTVSHLIEQESMYKQTHNITAF